MKYLLIAALLCAGFSSCKKTNSDPQTLSTLNLQPMQGKDVSVFSFSSGSAGPDTFQLAKYNYYGDSILYINGELSFELETNAITLIKFEGISLLPSTVKILSAKLCLYGVDSSINDAAILDGAQVGGDGNSYFTGADTDFSNTVLVKQITSAWDAQSVTYNSMPSFGDTASGIIAASTSRWDYNAVVDLTNLVQQWVENPASNFGISLSIANVINFFYENIYREMVFYSSYAQDSLRRPQLIIQYQ